MIDRKQILEVLQKYDLKRIKIGTIASHSALDVFDGAAEEGFETIAVCEKGREEPYSRFFKAQRDRKGRLIRGVVEKSIILNKFGGVILQENQKILRKENVIFIPNRSFTSYAKVEDIEENFAVPLMGSRNLLRTEERKEEKGYYWLLQKARLPYPEVFEDPEEIDCLVIVKLPHKVKRLERGFFTAASFKEYQEKVATLLKQNVIDRMDLEEARIERYIIGPVFNLDYFYSPIEEEGEKLELLGVDWRFETSLDGHVRLPAPQQLSLGEEQINPEYVVCGHNAATLRESLLGEVFSMGERYVKATQEYQPPGIIGPFTLQTCVDKDLHFYIYDVAPRIGGGTNIHMSVGHPYSNSLWRRNMSTGRRIALEVRRAIDRDRLADIVT